MYYVRAYCHGEQSALQSSQRPRSLTPLQQLADCCRVCQGLGGAFLPSPPMPTSNLEDICRDRYKSVKTSTLSGGLVLADMATRTSSELSAWGRLRTRMCLALPTLGREGSRWIRLGEFSYLQCLISLQNNSYQKQSPTLQARSPRQVLILPDWTLLSVPYYYNLVPTLTALATATCSTRSQCHHTAPVSSPPQYKHTSPPHLPLPSRRHTSLSARGEARVTLILSRDEDPA
jgi:hypothetical protein